MNQTQAMEYMEHLGKHGIVPGLGSIRLLCEKLGNPQDQLSFVHIAGTNGKGSVLAYVSTILQTAGYRTGRYISPTIFTYRERFQVNGRMIGQKLYCELLEQVKAAAEELVAQKHPEPTAFEVDTALAFLFFAKKNCEVVVLETGLGGLEDATNLIQTTKVAVLTSISMDHMGILGKTLTDIAENKAGIIKNNCYVISAKQEPEAETVLARVCREKQCKLTIADPDQVAQLRYGLNKQTFQYGQHKKLWEIRLAGTYQIDNAILAIETAHALTEAGYQISEEQIRQGLVNTSWPARFEQIAKDPVFIVDGAHNRDGARRLAESIRFYFTNRRIVYIMGILRDKEYEEIIRQTYPMATHIITVTPPGNPRALQAYELAQEVQKVHGSVTVADSLEEAVEISYLLAGKEDVIMAFGSLSYLGRLTELVKNRKTGRRKEHD